MVPALLLAMASFSGCDKANTPQQQGDIEIKNFQQSDCLNGIENLFDEKITFMAQGDSLHVELSKIMMDCCLESIDYEISKFPKKTKTLLSVSNQF